ncbi:MAG TPA: MBL fold metallo-hydrolase [Candidatus Baltobacteraceae bacterium]|nr:MBL fold metallo-hydrolase [Candidatus Baltobacteraceae bacterium]
MIVETFPVGLLACNATIVGDEDTREAIVVDGGDGVDDVLARLKQLGLRARYLIHTHAHFDHIADVGRLRASTRSSALLHHADLPIYHDQPRLVKLFGLPPIPEPVALDGDLSDGDRLTVGAVTCEVLHTPGHTPGSVCFALGNGETAILLTGDTLFAGSIGRWDLGGTSMEDIVQSIERKLMDYPDATHVVPGHGAFTTIGTERASNPYLRGR